MTAVTAREFSVTADNGVKPKIARPAAHQLSREELEALADKFVHGHSPSPTVTRASSHKIWIAGAAGLVATAMLLWFTLGAENDEGSKARTDVEPVMAPVENWAARRDAERQKHREQMARSSKYMEKMAAAEAAASADLRKQAAVLTAAELPSFEPGPADEPKPIEAAVKLSLDPDSQAQTSTAPVERSAEAHQQAPNTVSQGAVPGPTTAAAVPESASVVASKSTCSMHVSELSSGGTLTYDAVARIKGARLNEQTGYITLPPVEVSGRGSMIFTVMPDGCVRYRSAGSFGR